VPVSDDSWFSPRRGLNTRQRATVEKIFEAAETFLTDHDYEDLTLRLVAADAGVSAATVYTYFSSKNHLCAGVFCRYVLTAGSPALEGDTLARVQQVVRYFSDTIAGAPMLASAATRSLLASEPDVAELRLSLGVHWVSVFRQALGEAATPELSEALLLSFSGALLHAGMGALAYEDLGDHLARAVETVLRGNI
jgi:AcrR family transcriptional regulator